MEFYAWNYATWTGNVMMIFLLLNCFSFTLFCFQVPCSRYLDLFLLMASFDYDHVVKCCSVVNFKRFFIFLSFDFHSVSYFMVLHPHLMQILCCNQRKLNSHFAWLGTGQLMASARTNCHSVNLTTPTIYYQNREQPWTLGTILIFIWTFGLELQLTAY